jgi:hypothetical protein
LSFLEFQRDFFEESRKGERTSSVSNGLPPLLAMPIIHSSGEAEAALLRSNSPRNNRAKDVSSDTAPSPLSAWGFLYKMTYSCSCLKKPILDGVSRKKLFFFRSTILFFVWV